MRLVCAGRDLDPGIVDVPAVLYLGPAVILEAPGNLGPWHSLGAKFVNCSQTGALPCKPVMCARNRQHAKDRHGYERDDGKTRGDPQFIEPDENNNGDRHEAECIPVEDRPLIGERN